MSPLEDRVRAWVTVAMSRMVITAVKDTTSVVARVRGFAYLPVVAHEESCIEEAFRVSLSNWAHTRIASGEGLPEFERPRIEVPPEVRAIVRLSRLKSVLKDRVAQWHSRRQNLPAHVTDALLADLDAVITRHAAAIPSAQ